MGEVINLQKYREREIERWNEVLSHDGEYSTCQAFLHEGTGDLEIVQMNDDGEVIRSVLSRLDAECFAAAIINALLKRHAGGDS